MHDARNRPIQEGQLVLIPAIIKTAYATPDYCNITVESALPRRPDGAKEIITLNSGAVVLADEHFQTGSDLNFYTEQVYGPWTKSVGTCG